MRSESAAYLFMCVVVGVDVVVKLLVFEVLLVTQLAVEVGSQVLQSGRHRPLLLSVVLRHTQTAG